jgi:ADP-dependent NAD(P)H-hydrate dehydratase / NAD(P)H-hydrate epimerase
MRVVSSQEMKEIEKETIESIGLDESLIIENVGLSGAKHIETLLDTYEYPREVVLLVGPGNNGADGLAIGRHLSNRGHSVRAFMLFSAGECGEELKKQARLAQNFGVKINETNSVNQILEFFSQLNESPFVIDAILGMGLRLPLSNKLFDLVKMVNEYASPLICIDMPTGICSDKGTMSGNAMMADYTLTVALPKTGLYIGEGAKHAGEVIVLEGGFPEKLLSGGDKWLLDPASVSGKYRLRSKFDHKNRFGHCLIVGGSPGLTGAAIMASEAALKVGTGLVTASTWEESYKELSSRLIPEIMMGLIPTEKKEVEDIIKSFERWNSIVLGPGLGRSENSRQTVLDVLNHFAGPVVVDADAIRVLNIDEDRMIFAQRKWPTVFTPHVGEFADLMGVDTQEVIDKPLEYLKKAVDITNSIFVVKSFCTYLGSPNGEVYINYAPNDGMASGGSGDVLAGMIGGLLAQYPMEKKSSSLFADPSVVYSSIRLGLVVHTMAGAIAAKDLGVRAMTARNIIDYLSPAFKELAEIEGLTKGD